MITINELRKCYTLGENNTVTALDGVSFEVNDGELVFVMGKSGSGKSTLLHILGGIDRPTSGSIKYGDIEITSLSERKLALFRRDNIGFVFQDYNLVPELTAAENIKYPVLLAGKKPDRGLWEHLISTLELGDRLEHLPFQLSGGQQQRVAIARALISDPQVILCDEPTGNLDSEAAENVQNMLFRLNSDLKKTVIIVTHDPDFAQKGKRTITLMDGRII
ncbi:MAG: ABC transporter ATP-binding protein [Oscillospiraceae bacterium]